MNQGIVKSITFKDKEGKSVSLTFTIDRNIVIDEKVDRALKWFYDTIGRQQIKIKSLEKEDKYHQIALVKEYMKLIGHSLDVKLGEAIQQLQSTEVSEVVQAWNWIIKEANKEEKNELKQIQFKLDQGSILYKIILLNIIHAISFLPNLKQLAYLWELQQQEIYYLVSKLLLEYAKKSEENYNKVCGFISGKIEQIDKIEKIQEQDLIASEVYNLIWLINELDTIHNSDRLIKELKQKNIDKVIQLKLKLKIVELQDEELIQFPQLVQRQSAQAYKIEPVKFDEELNLFQIRLEQFNLDQKSLGLEIEKNISKEELIQKVKDQDSTIQQQQDEIKIIRDKLSLQNADIVEILKKYEQVLNNCKCFLNQQYKTEYIKPQEYGLMSIDNRKMVHHRGLISFSRRVIEQPDQPFVIPEPLGFVVQAPIKNQNIQQEQPQQQQIRQDQQQPPQNMESPTKAANPPPPPLPGFPPPPPQPGNQDQKFNLLQSTFGVAVKQIDWNQIKKEILPKSMWAKVKEDLHIIQQKIDKQLIIENFKKEEIKQNQIEFKVEKQKQKLTRLDEKRSKEIHVSIKTLKIPIKDIVEKINSQDLDFFAPLVDDKRDTNKLIIAIKLCPTEQEINLYKDITDDETLHEYDQAIFKVSKVPLYAEKLQLMIALIECEQEQHKFIEQANNLIALIKVELLPDQKFFDALKYMFAYGQFINQDSKRGQYQGVRLTDINEISVKTKSGKTFHYFVISEMLNQKQEFDLIQDLQPLEYFSNKDKDFNLLKTSTLLQFKKYQQNCIKLLALEQKPEYVQLLEYVNFTLDLFNQKIEIIDELSNMITFQLGEDPERIQLWQLFDQILKFKKMVISTVKEIQQEEVIKEKRRLQKLSDKQREKLGRAQGRH